MKSNALAIVSTLDWISGCNMKSDMVHENIGEVINVDDAYDKISMNYQRMFLKGDESSFLVFFLVLFMYQTWR